MKKNIWLWLAIFLAGALAGWLIGRAGGNNAKIVVSPVADNQAAVALNQTTGQVVAVKSASLLFKTRIHIGESLLMQQKEARVNDSTVIYALTPKGQDGYFSDDYNQKLQSLRQALQQAQGNQSGAQKTITQIRAVTAEAVAAQNLQIKTVTEKLAALPEGSPDKNELSRQLAELNSNFKYQIIKLSDIKPEASVQVWSDQDMAANDKFMATRIEVRQ